MGVYKQGFVKPTKDREEFGYPHDPQDYAYMRHDICYGEARLNNQDCPPSRLRDLFNQCDIDLFNDLISLGFTLHDASFTVHQLGGILAFAIQPGVRNTINQWEYYYEHGERSPWDNYQPGIGLTYRF